jgi:hypothetical protein
VCAFLFRVCVSSEHKKKHEIFDVDRINYVRSLVSKSITIKVITSVVSKLQLCLLNYQTNIFINVIKSKN